MKSRDALEEFFVARDYDYQMKNKIRRNMVRQSISNRFTVGRLSWAANIPNIERHLAASHSLLDSRLYHIFQYSSRIGIALPNCNLFCYTHAGILYVFEFIYFLICLHNWMAKAQRAEEETQPQLKRI